MHRVIGVNTWVWTSPLTDENLPAIARRAAEMGFGAIELPVENVGDWNPARTRDLLDELGLAPYVVGAMAPGRDLVDPGAVADTQTYLRACIEAARALGATVVAGPFTASTGRTWRMSADERADVVATVRAGLAPLVDDAIAAGVTLAIEPLNRYETSIINTVEQGLDVLEPLLGPGLGLALDSYHLNIEEKHPADAIRLAGSHLVHMQVCGTDRGATGDDHADWPATLDALDDAGYTGPLNLESFTALNDTIATAASIWRPLAASQDELARRTLDHLTRLQEARR